MNVHEHHDEFVRGYIAAVYFTEEGDEHHDGLDDASRALAVADCISFQNLAALLLTLAYDRGGYDAGRAGHDFWLTRNGHGAGFWDREELDEGGLGQALTDACNYFDAQYCEVARGDDDKNYLSFY